MSLSINRGMYFEELIMNTAKHYTSQNQLLIFKRDLPIKVIRFMNLNTVMGRVHQNALVDYYGVYQGHHFEFEAKQTNGEKFVLANIAQHQFDHLENIWKSKGIAFLLIYFVKYNSCFLVTFTSLDSIWKKAKQLDLAWFQKNALLVEIIFPGYLNLLDYFENHLVL